MKLGYQAPQDQLESEQKCKLPSPNAVISIMTSCGGAQESVLCMKISENCNATLNFKNHTSINLLLFSKLLRYFIYLFFLPSAIITTINMVYVIAGNFYILYF